MYKDRIDLYNRLEKQRDSKLIVYVTGDRPGLETQISNEVLDFFLEHLDSIGVTKKISLYLYTRGGETLAGWSIVNLIRQFCDDFEIIIPSKAHSTGTLMCLSANRIVMTKQATLGPIDPSLNTPLNPQIKGASPDARYPVSVEAIQGYIELAKKEIGIKDDNALCQVLLKLSDMVHPLVLGQVYRTRTQIQMLARKLIKHQITEKTQIEAVISFLCSESGSHDYSINRREAKTNLNLKVEKPTDELYDLIKHIHADIRSELELSSRFDPLSFIGSAANKKYEFRRCLVESIPYGSNYFISEGTFIKKTITSATGISQTTIEDQRIFEGWRHYK